MRASPITRMRSVDPEHRVLSGLYCIILNAGNPGSGSIKVDRYVPVYHESSIVTSFYNATDMLSVTVLLCH